MTFDNFYLLLVLDFVLQETLDEATECWGIMVERVEMYVQLYREHEIANK